MTVSDRAFIRAYARDQGESLPPAPHFAPKAADWQQQPPPSRTSDDPYASETVVVAAGVPTPQRSRRRRSHIPAPHLPLDRGGAPVGITGLGTTGTRNRLTSAEPKFTPPAAPATSGPLSNFVASTPAPVALEPALEVTAFMWPERCGQLLAYAGRELQELADRLAAATTDKLLAITGLFRGEGRTSLLLALASQFARQNVRTVVVDADFAHPEVADQLGLAVDGGWEQVLSGRRSLADALIVSQQDRFTVLPLAAAQAECRELLDGSQAPVTFGMLRDRFDLVLVDAGPVLAEGSTAPHLLSRCGGGAALVVCDCRARVDSELARAAAVIENAGVHVLGVAENFSTPMLHKSRTEAALSAAAM